MKSVALSVALVASVAFADVDARFAKLRDSAEALGGLGGFTEKYVGECGSRLLGGAECEKNAEAFRKAATGKKYYMIITEETASLLQMGEVTGQGEFILNLTPFFAGGEFAVTQGEPKSTDANGNPKMPFIRIPSMMPENWNPAMMARQVAGQQLRLQVVFTPQGTWSLPKKGGGQIKGIKAKIDGVLVTVGRTGDQVGLWFGK